MENKKSLSTIFILVISAHIYLFAQLKVPEEQTIVAPKPTNSTVQINMKNVVLKKQDIKPEKKQIKKVEKKKIVKKLPKTQSKNIVKTEKKQKKKRKEKPVKKIVETKPTKEIFKEKVVEQISTKAAEIKEKQIPVETLKAIENEYLLKLKRLIEKNKEYPSSAKRLKQMGKVYLSFTIHKNGKIADVQITKNSNFKKLNKAAMEIMAKIQKFEPIPNELNKSTWNITVPVVYQIIRS
jgi:periplasmic protein TonB